MVKAFSVVVFVLLGLILFFMINSNNINIDKDIKIEKSYLKHKGINISSILNEKNYKKIGINPEKYENFNDFLSELSNYENIDFNPIDEKFVIGAENDYGFLDYIGFNYKELGYLFEDEVYKNLAILDIYDAYQKGNIFGGSNSSSADKVYFQEDFIHEHTSIINDIFNVDVFDDSNNVFNIINELSNIELDNSYKELLSYLHDFTGEYDKGHKIRKNIDSIKYLDVTFYGYVKDSENNPLSFVDIYLLNNGNNKYTTSEEGYFEFEVNLPSFSHIRLKSNKKGYSDAYNTISLNEPHAIYDNKKIRLNFTMHKANETFTINNDNKKDKSLGQYYIIEAKGSKYFIPYDGLYYSDLSKYTHTDITVYHYQFNRDTDLDDMLDNDTFEPISGYVGNIMVTFGMPYIQIIDNKTGKELYTRSSNPVILQNQVKHMQELYDNADGLYGAITPEDMKFLVEYSEKKGGYPIDFEFLTSNNFLRWPARWTLNRDTGIWANVGHRVINTDGLVELPFYHIK